MENSIQNNPLAKHFRQPAIYLKLPSQGKYYPPGVLELGVTGEIPIYPMTVKDELALRTPDALMNGSSIHSMLQSCCPSIKDPWTIPTVDVDSILIAIRLASYGHDMDINSKCTNCESDNEHTIDLRQVLERVQTSTAFDKRHLVSHLVFELQPQTFREFNLSSIITFEQRKLLSVIQNADLTEDQKKEEFRKSFDKLADLNLKLIIDAIKSITTEDGTQVTERELIKDFLNNCDRKTYDEIKDIITAAMQETQLAPVEVTCPECETVYKATLEFNQSNFFE